MPNAEEIPERIETIDKAAIQGVDTVDSAYVVRSKIFEWRISN